MYHTLESLEFKRMNDVKRHSIFTSGLLRLTAHFITAFVVHIGFLRLTAHFITAFIIHIWPSETYSILYYCFRSTHLAFWDLQHTLLLPPQFTSSILRLTAHFITVFIVHHFVETIDKDNTLQFVIRFFSVLYILIMFNHIKSYISFLMIFYF